MMSPASTNHTFAQNKADLCGERIGVVLDSK